MLFSINATFLIFTYIFLSLWQRSGKVQFAFFRTSVSYPHKITFCQLWCLDHRFRIATVRRMSMEKRMLEGYEKGIGNWRLACSFVTCWIGKDLEKYFGAVERFNI